MLKSMTHAADCPALAASKSACQLPWAIGEPTFIVNVGTVKAILLHVVADGMGEVCRIHTGGGGLVVCSKDSEHDSDSGFVIASQCLLAAGGVEIDPSLHSASVESFGGQEGEHNPVEEAQVGDRGRFVASTREDLYLLACSAPGTAVHSLLEYITW